jgi:hypothetical protein
MPQGKSVRCMPIAGAQEQHPRGTQWSANQHSRESVGVAVNCRLEVAPRFRGPQV